MKRPLLCLLFFASVPVFAKAPSKPETDAQIWKHLSPHHRYCYKMSQLVSLAVTERNSGLSPQQTWSLIKETGYWHNKEEDKTAKQVINKIYFSGDYDNVSAAALGNAVFMQCMHPQKPWHPLK